jgi:hypothetical protein
MGPEFQAICFRIFAYIWQGTYTEYINVGGVNPFHLFKGTVSPDIGLHFSFWKIKLVLSAEPHMVLKFFYFVVPEIFKNLYSNCFYENTY